MICKPKPAEYETCTSDPCLGCGSGSLWITKTLKRNITKAPRTVKAVATPRSINTCRCRSCDRDGIEPETGLPNNGSYDPSITTEVADGYACRTPFRMTADRARRYGITLSSGTVHSIMRRPEASLGTPTADTATAMRRAGILHIDETSLYINGRTVWVWILYDPSTGHALYTIQDSRGADVLSKTLGNWDGIIVCDGWSAYRGCCVQRC